MAQSAFYIGFAIILCVVTISLGYPSGESLMNVKLEFHLTKGKNGKPSIIKVKKFESGEYNRRAESTESSKEKEIQDFKNLDDKDKKPTTPKVVRAGTSSSSSEEDAKDKDELSFETSKQKTVEEASADESLPKSRVTRGGGYEPEGDGAKNYNSDSDGRRRKRSVKKNKYNLKKKINKLFLSGRKQG